MALRLWPLIALPLALAGLAVSLALRAGLAQPTDAAGPDESRAAASAGVRPPVEPPRPLPRPPARPSPAPELPAAEVATVPDSARVTVYARPGGNVATVVTGRTEFGSPRALGVVRRRGPWLGVTLPELGNGRLGWVHRGQAGVEVHRTALRVEIDLSSRQLLLRQGSRVLRRVRVSVGRAGSPTPVGRFAVTDKLPGHRFSSVYGCCILALSGRQPRLPVGWTGGDRLAIHGTVPGAPIGGRVSAGCLHASETDLRALMQAVPVGAPVVIRA